MYQGLPWFTALSKERIVQIENKGFNCMDIIENCKKILIECENVIFSYIFGSYASKLGREDSDIDIDIAIYLKDQIDTKEYLNIKTNLIESCGKEIDLIILNEATPLLKLEIYRNNILLFTRDKTIESNFKVKRLFEYSDMKKYLDMVYEENIKRMYSS